MVLNDYDRIFAAVGAGRVFVGLRVVFPGYAVEKIPELVFAIRSQVKRRGERSVLLPLHRCNASVPIVEIANQVNGVGKSGQLLGKSEANLTKRFCLEVFFLEAHKLIP